MIPTHEKEGLVQHLQLSHTEKPPKAKLLLFHENQRPPYWGTWRKPMKSVTPKNPFAKEVSKFKIIIICLKYGRQLRS